MRREASLCGLALVVATEGEREACAQFATALQPHVARARGDGQPDAEVPLELQLKLLPGLPPSFDRLAVSRRDGALEIRGDGLSGALGERAARMEVFGGGPGALQIAMRLACALWLAPRHGLLLHGASVEVGGRALALLGPSGAGKTTLARRLAAAGAHVIADEVVAVRAPGEMNANSFRGGAPRLYGHPLPRRLGDGLAPEEGLPLAAIGLLSHGPEGAAPRAERLDLAQAARAILQRVFLPAADAAIVEGALACVEALARAVPVVALFLPDDERAAQAALALLNAPRAGAIQ